MAADSDFVHQGAPGQPLSPLCDGPYRVVARNPKVFELELGGRWEKMLVDMLKPCLASEVLPAAPPRLGRPHLST